MTYTKPQLIAQNASTGSYAAGCPANNRSGYSEGNTPERICVNCELTR